MAFFTEEWDGKPVDPTLNGIPVDIFKTEGSVAESVFMGEKIFGPDGYVNNIGNPRAQAEAMQSMLRMVIDYTKVRGWKTCVGFELMHPRYGSFTFTDKEGGAWNTINPVDPHSADLSVERLHSLVKTYPNADYYALWQSEGHGFYARTVGKEQGAAEMRNKYAYWAQSSPVWGDTVLSGDIDYAYLFREISQRLTSEERSKLATGGWSIEHLFPAIDSEFPSELIFSSMNAYNPPPALRHELPSFKIAKNGRRTWMTDWWEYDGGLWFAQFRAGWHQFMYDRCVEYGVEGISLVGWKLSGIEHNIRYLEDYSWNQGLSAYDFYNNYTRLMYGCESDELADIFMRYDKMEPEMPPATVGYPAPMHLGIGIFPLKIRSVPTTVDGSNDADWKQTVRIAENMIADQKKLYDIDRDTIDLLDELLKKTADRHKSYIRLLKNRLEFRCLYIKGMISLNESLIAYDDNVKKGVRPAVKASLKHVEESLRFTKQAIEKYAEEIRNTNDLGLIAQLNEQHYKVIENYMISLGGSGTKFAEIDADKPILPATDLDFMKTQWQIRDGKVEIDSRIENGLPIIDIKLGGFGVKDNSVWIYNNVIDINETPYLSFMIKTSSPDSLALMYRVDNDPNWYALNILGIHTDYAYADGLPAGSMNDGVWHRVVWDLKTLADKKIPQADARIRDLILGTWTKPYQPVAVSFKEFSMGTQ